VLPYHLVLLAVVGVLVARHACSDASERSKRLVVGLSACALLLPVVWSGAALVANLVLIGVGVYVAIHREVTSSGG
jgi:RsiW-degrading membrane proteinase PrsW (M82 family)